MIPKRIAERSAITAVVQLPINLRATPLAENTLMPQSSRATQYFVDLAPEFLNLIFFPWQALIQPAHIGLNDKASAFHYIVIFPRGNLGYTEQEIVLSTHAILSHAGNRL
ncbi:MAG: hypothetical protein K2X81_24060 [Candidatus Obscuribacterales bacterium]|jgi:hypothetical protein|nr:hypothetical protein [Candidatus Obscuribacterales bacterium]